MNAEAAELVEKGRTLDAPVCNVCGSPRFEPGFRGRLMNGIPPACVKCKTVERHRAIHRVYSELRPLLHQWRALHFAPDQSVDPEWFKSYRSSIYGTPSSLDMLDTGLPDQSFDIVMSNHVLEHVPDPVCALNECLRLVGPAGIVHAMVPAQAWDLNDWEFPDPAKNEHWREFGANFGLSVAKNIPGTFCIGILGSDPVTAAADMIYLISRSQASLAKVHQMLPRVGIQVVRFF